MDHTSAVLSRRQSACPALNDSNATLGSRKYSVRMRSKLFSPRANGMSRPQYSGTRSITSVRPNSKRPTRYGPDPIGGSVNGAEKSRPSHQCFGNTGTSPKIDGSSRLPEVLKRNTTRFGPSVST